MDKIFLGKLNLKRKILLVILLLNFGLITSTLLIVNVITDKETDKTLQSNLKKTQILFENYLALRNKEILVENKLIGETPFLKALLSTKDKATILGFARDSQEQIGSDLLIVTDGKGEILASTVLFPDESEFKNEVSIKSGLSGKEANEFLLINKTLYEVASAPMKLGEAILGTLTIGFKVDNALTQEIKTMTHSEISFILGENLIASTWNGTQDSLIKESILSLKDKIHSLADQNESTPPFDLKMGNETFLSVLVPLSNHGSLKGAYLIQRSRDEVRQFLNAIQKAIFIVGFLILVIAIWMGWLVAKQIVDPITAIVTRSKEMAEGNLSISVAVQNRDEIGVLGQAFNDMAQKLRGLILQVQKITMAISDVTRKLNQTSQEISTEINKQETAVNETTVSVIQMEQSIQEVNQNVASLSISTEETSSSVLEMDASIKEIVNHMNHLSTTIDTNSLSITGLTANIKEIADGHEVLNQITIHTAASLHELNASVQEVELNAKEGNALSEQTAQEAMRGMKSVNETIDGMQEIKTSFLELQKTVSRLSGKSEAIGKVVQVISEVTQQTNLLALNAAIIAAQAGEQGKEFAVVAEEVKNLSGRTETSAQEISVLIKDVQDEIDNSVKAVTKGSERIQKGVLLSNEAGDRLKTIIESSKHSSENVSQIVKATREQVTGIQEVDKAMGKITAMVQQLNQATQQQEKASTDIMKSSKNLRKLGEEVKMSTQEQSKGSQLIRSSIEKVIEMTRKILMATQQQKQGSENINHAVQVFKETSQSSVAHSTEMNTIVSVLSEHSKQLEKELLKFKT